MATVMDSIKEWVGKALEKVSIVDVHTHLFNSSFGELLLWGIDELLTYHYLVAEVMRYTDISYDGFWGMSKKEQAEFVWDELFVKRVPISEAARGVVSVLSAFGLDLSSKSLDTYRDYFSRYSMDEYIDTVLEMAHIDYLVMTNDPFDEKERIIWDGSYVEDRRFRPALRLDQLLNGWLNNWFTLKSWGYNVGEVIDSDTLKEIKRFLRGWIKRMSPVYMAVSLPPSFELSYKDPASIIIQEAVLPVAEEFNLPFAMMVGVKKLSNPMLRLAGDSVGKANIGVIEYLCRSYPHNKFLVLMLSKENQHELIVAARKFRNLHIFGCWWFLNNPSIVREITSERLDMLGFSFTFQHSDARVLDQLIYKWRHSKDVILPLLIERYSAIIRSGWHLSEVEIEKGVNALFGGEFQSFLDRRF